MKNRLLQFALCLIALTLYPLKSDGQWIQTNGISSDSVTCFALVDTNFFAGGRGGVYRFDLGGANWNTVDSGLVNHSVRYSFQLVRISLLELMVAYFVPRTMEQAGVQSLPD